jgi:tetratricopeptide (TPR) repeat protein
MADQTNPEALSPSLRSIRTLLLLYDELDPVERDRADRHLKAHPEDQTLVEEGRRVRNLASEAADAALSDDVIAAVIAARVLEGGRLSPALQLAAARIDRARAEDPEVAGRYEQLENRLHELLPELPSPRSQFEQLMGRESAADPRPLARRRQADRAPARPEQRRLGTYLVAAFLMLAAVGVGLALLLPSPPPRHVQMAALHEMPASYEPLRLRGIAGAVEPGAAALDRGLAAVAEARRGPPLFRRFDEAGLHEAVRHFEAAAAIAPGDSPLAAAAHLAIGRVHLHLGDLQQARQVLSMVASLDAPAAPFAADLLDAMEREGLNPADSR